MTAIQDVPDLGQFLEVAEATRLSRSSDPDVAAYYTGVIVGFNASFVDDDVFLDALTEARRHRWSATYDLTSAVGRWQLLGYNVEQDANKRRVFLRACGILFGFKEGTSERPDAETCTMCEARILTETDDEAEHCGRHGWFCNDDCRRAVCLPNGLGRGNCWED